MCDGSGGGDLCQCLPHFSINNWISLCLYENVGGVLLMSCQPTVNSVQWYIVDHHQIISNLVQIGQTFAVRCVHVDKRAMIDVFLCSHECVALV